MTHLALLSEIITSGRTVEAIRRVYVDIHGGLTLDIPEWLEQGIDQLNGFTQADQTDGTLVRRLTLLRTIVQRANDDPHVNDEMYAELLSMQGSILEERVFANNAEACETAIVSREAALKVYTIARYPRQYAATQVYLGSTYRKRIEGTRSTNLEHAITCFEAALQWSEPILPVHSSITLLTDLTTLVYD